MSFYQPILVVRARRSAFLMRFLVGLVFLSEGIQRFLLPVTLGGALSEICISAPEFIAPSVGPIEILCRCLLVLGSLSRAVAVRLLAVILVSTPSTELPMRFAGNLWHGA